MDPAAGDPPEATFLLGTRPEILKAFPVIAAARRRHIRCRVIHSGQHYAFAMSEVFFHELGLPRPDALLGVGSGSHARQLGLLLTRLDAFKRKSSLKNLVVVGDTNTVLAGALFARREGIPLFHVEAGARCYDPDMPEEQNRRVTDHLSDVLFAPTRRNRDILARENVLGRVHVTGNPVIDACVRMLAKISKSSRIIDQIGFEEFVLCTAHRPEIVDDRWRFAGLLRTIRRLDLPVVFPCHPRTRVRLREFGFLRSIASSPNVVLLPPLGYIDFLTLMKKAAFVVSDSGGVTEEATSPGLDKLVFSPRTRTEVPEAIESGHLVLIGTDDRSAIRRIRKRLNLSRRPRGHPYGVGHAGEKIAAFLHTYLNDPRLDILASKVPRS